MRWACESVDLTQVATHEEMDARIRNAAKGHHGAGTGTPGGAAAGTGGDYAAACRPAA
ncbi:hypothetical protein RAA17_11405 [Komagataeibacter rhaeticus]|nr:hypothetical protein [Komagataeibacter rhaeticus]